MIRLCKRSYIYTIVLMLFPVVFFCCSRADKAKPVRETDKFQLVSEVKYDTKSPFYIDFNDYPAVRNDLPIGVFDSGTGGLTVLDAIMRMDKYDNLTRAPGADGKPDFTAESFIYLGDKANMPYGRYDSEGKSDFLNELILKDVQFLLGQKYYFVPEQEIPNTNKPQVKAIVIACNTATAYGLDLVQEVMREWGSDVKVIGIIEAGSEEAVSELPSSGEDRIIGVFATEGACASGGYPRAIEKFYTRRFHSKVGIFQQPGFGLAGAIDGDPSYIAPQATEVRGKEIYQGPGLDHPKYPIELSLIEEYNFESGNNLLIKKDADNNVTAIELNSVNNYIRYYVTTMVTHAAAEFPGRSLDAVILGCTHYPFFSNEISEHFLYLKHLNKEYDRIIPAEIELIDPALAEAKELYEYMKQEELFGSGTYTNSRFFISVPNPGLASNQITDNGEFPLAYKYGREINKSWMYVKRVPFAKKWLGIVVLERIKAKMPLIYETLMQNKGWQ